MKFEGGIRRAAYLSAAGAMAVSGIALTTAGTSGAANHHKKNPLNPGYPTCVTHPLSKISYVRRAQKAIAKSQNVSTKWTGPTKGPKAKKGVYVAILENDVSNPGDSGFGQGVQEAAKVLGWRTQVFNGQASNSATQAAFEQAIATHPNAIAATSVAIPTAFGTQALAQAHAQHIIIVDRHGGAEPGTGASQGSSDVFWNIQPNTVTTGRLAGNCAVVAAAEYGKRAGIVIGTQNGFPLTNTKSGAIAFGVQHFGGKLLRMESYPFASIAQEQPTYTASDLQTFGSRLTAFESINDLYCDATIPVLKSEGYSNKKLPVCIAAGDGSAAAFKRIQTHDYQIATLADPNELQGWIAMDQINRGLHGQKPYKWNPPVHIVDAADVGHTLAYNPKNGYKKHYEKIWGVK